MKVTMILALSIVVIALSQNPSFAATPTSWPSGSLLLSSKTLSKTIADYCQTTVIGQSSFYSSSQPNTLLMGLNLTRIYETTAQPTVPHVYQYWGTGQLVFSSSTAGQILFDATQSMIGPKKVKPVPVAFTNYSSVYNEAAGMLTVTMDVTIAHCTLPITAVYRD